MIGIASVVARMTDKGPAQARSGPDSQKVPPTSPTAAQNASRKAKDFTVPPSPHKGDPPPAAANAALTGSAPKSGASWVPPIPSSQHPHVDLNHLSPENHYPWLNHPTWDVQLDRHLDRINQPPKT
jgi:hypothetical protein